MLRQLTMAGLACVVALSLSGIAFAGAQDQGSEHRTARQYGYQSGYKDGFHHGRQDSRAGAKYDYKSDDFKNATHGYDKFMGERDDYKKGYQKGYVAGYDDAYYGRQARFDTLGVENEAPDVDQSGREARDRVPYVDESDREGNSTEDVAYNVGYRDGLIDGEKDRKDAKDFRPSKHSKYQDADDGFQAAYGKKKIYQAEYRQGYLAGYQHAYGSAATQPAP